MVDPNIVSALHLLIVSAGSHSSMVDPNAALWPSMRFINSVHIPLWSILTWLGNVDGFVRT